MVGWSCNDTCNSVRVGTVSPCTARTFVVLILDITAVAIFFFLSKKQGVLVAGLESENL